MSSKKILTVIGGIMVIAAIAFCALFFYGKEKFPFYLLDIFPDANVKVLGMDEYDLGGWVVYSKKVKVGNDTLYLVAHENKANDGITMYRFYSSGKEPKMLKAVNSSTRFNEGADAVLNQKFWQKDITGDGIDELFIQLKTVDGGRITRYEILRYENGELVNIRMEGNPENEVELDDANFEDGYVALTDISTYARGKTRYRLQDNELVEVGRVSFFADEDMNGACNARIETRGNMTSQTQRVVERVENCDIFTENFDPYWTKAKPLTDDPFMKDLAEAKTDPKWQKLAEAYEASCNRFGGVGSSMNPRELLFRPLIEAIEPSRVYADGSKALIIPCDWHAYQTSEFVTLYDGQSYIPLNGGMILTSAYYDPARDLFTSFYKGRGLGDCGEAEEYKLVGKELVLQKKTAKEECDGNYDEWPVIYQR